MGRAGLSGATGCHLMGRELEGGPRPTACDPVGRGTAATIMGGGSSLSPGTKGLWAKFKYLWLTEGILQRAWMVPATGEKIWQIVVPKDMQEAVLKAMHGFDRSGHFRVTKTLRHLHQTFNWGRLRHDVEDFCRRCDLFTACKGPQGKSRAQLQQFLVGEPMQWDGVDVMGPFPCTMQGNCFVLTAMDYFTKWPEAFALPNQEADLLPMFWWRAYLVGLGCPSVSIVIKAETSSPRSSL